VAKICNLDILQKKKVHDKKGRKKEETKCKRNTTRRRWFAEQKQNTNRIDTKHKNRIETVYY